MKKIHVWLVLAATGFLLAFCLLVCSIRADKPEVVAKEITTMVISIIPKIALGK